MTITLEAIRAAGGIVHSDGNIFFRDISMLQGLAGAAPAAVAGPVLDVRAIAAAVCQRVAELPDRNSPEDWPEAMLVTGQELIDVVTCELEQAQAAPALEAPAAPVRQPLTRDEIAAWAAETLEEVDYPVLCKTAPCAYELLNLLETFARAHGITAAAPQAPAAPSADEREAFEAWIKKDGGDLSTFGSGQNRHYNNSAVNNAWTGWSSRAKLAAPAAPVAAITDAMVDAYLTTQRRSVEQADRLPMGITPTNAVREACRQGLLAAIGAAPAAPAAPAVDAETIHLQDLKNAMAECQELRQQLTLMDEQQAGTVWRWQADGRDQLATMGNRMGVLIYACDLRALLADAAPATAAIAEVIGCFDAANIEGLDDALVNNTDARLADLVQRRLLHAGYAAIGAQQAIAAQAAAKGEHGND
ncbi:hypothetical protein [Delftia sp. WSY_14]|uniref:hypothetical protein n=1 Tax=unclassified Delftia TaxID=2613839 RepID=UPI00370B6ED7